MAPDVVQERDDDGIDEFRDWTKWAILVNTDTGNWFPQRVRETVELGDFEDEVGNPKNTRIGAFFDLNVESLLKAMTEIGGNSIEGNERIADLLAGVCRSFVEAQANLEKWRSPEA